MLRYVSVDFIEINYGELVVLFHLLAYRSFMQKECNPRKPLRYAASPGLFVFRKDDRQLYTDITV